jgi:hypothetical protein
VDHALQPAGTRHVDAVVVARAQVQRGEVAAAELRGQRLSPPTSAVAL